MIYTKGKSRIPTSKSTPSTVGRAPSDPMQEFNKGVQRDPSSFPTMESIEQWENWQRATAEHKG